MPFVAERASAQSYPARPVRVIVAYAPGGVTDVLTRLIVGKVGEQLGRQFYVENIPGGSGNIGMGQAAKAAPDGYTLLGAFAALAINPILFEKTPYDPVKDFEPISLAATSTTILVVNPTVPAKSVAELVALVRANPGKYSYSSAGIGTQSHLAGEQFRLSLGLDIVHVPFNGGSPAVAAVVAGHTPIGFATPTAAAPQIEDGKVRGLAVTSKQRSRALPGRRHHDGSRPRRHRGRQLGRLRRAGRNAEGRRHPAQPRDRAGDRAARHPRQAHRARLRPGRQHAGGARRADQDPTSSPGRR